MPRSSSTTQKLLPLLLDNLQDYALFLLDTQGIVVSWTPGVLRLLGYEESEFIGLDVNRIFTTQDQLKGALQNELHVAAQEGKVEQSRWHRRKDGTTFWAHEQLIALRDDDGNLRGFAKILRDDTGRRSMEEDLRATRERLQSALDVGGIGTWNWDIPHDRVTADANLANFFGVTKEEALGSPIANYIRAIHPEDVERVFGAIEASIANDATFNEDYRLIQKDGSVLWVEARGRIDVGAQGQPQSLNGVVVDISERKRADGALRESEERYRTLFEAIDNGFCVIEMIYDEANKPIDYLFLEINPAFERQTGLKDAIGKTALELVPQLDDFWFQTYGRVGLTGESIQFENWAEAMGRWFDVNAFRVGGSESRRVAVLFTDITGRKRGEEALRRAHIQSEETNRLKDQFLATLSHELRTPLNAILGWANILRTNELDRETQKKGLETIERNARSQAQLINDLLDVSRILTGKMRLELQPVELAEALENALKNVMPAIEAKEIDLKTDIDHAVGLIAADTDRLGQIFWNLLSNAIKFTPKGGAITVKMMRVASQIQVQITDTGQGIEPSFLPYVFERFRQADASSTRTYGGLGIGLALVRHLMEAHGGTVRAESAGEGLGSTFSVVFPIKAMRLTAKDEVDAKVETEVMWSDQEANLPSLENLNILVVDDEKDAREMIQIALQKRGATVSLEESVAGAFSMFVESREKEQPFDILISDVGMPKEDGFSLIRRIRSIETNSSEALPAIALTAYASPKDRMDALLAGFQVHMSKPVDAAELIATVAGLTGRSGQEE
jgi:PAS domain S-box-containing protein